MKLAGLARKLLAVWCTLAGWSTCHADTLTMSLKLDSNTSSFSNGVGGEFMGYSINGVPYKDQANVVQLQDNTFQTFCVEYNESFIEGRTLYAQINEYARFGSGGGTPDPFHPGMMYDLLDDRTAYLFTKFSLGELNNYSYTPGSSRVASAGHLQKAIWYLEQEVAFSSITVQAQQWVAEANAAVAAGGSWYGKGLGNVRVLNLWTDATHQDKYHKAQDQLVFLDLPQQAPPAVPLPSVALGGTGLFMALGLLRRAGRMG
jgi:hypothetical protein